jgi:hypothetical protein
MDKPPPPEIVIPAQDAVFWMDSRGRWCNRHGPFRNPRIIDYFHRSIRRDADGYFVTQVRDGLREKVYFRHGETPIFAVDVRLSHPPLLLLNTKRQIPLEPSSLWIRADTLFMKHGSEVVQFSERVMVKLSSLMEDTPEGLDLRLEGVRHRIREKEASGGQPDSSKGSSTPA